MLFMASLTAWSINSLPESTTFMVFRVKSLTFSFFVVICAWAKALVVMVNAASIDNNLFVFIVCIVCQLSRNKVTKFMCTFV